MSPPKRHSVQHASFTIERSYPASPARVFRAFADPSAKAAWFKGPHDRNDHTLDFRVGGREHASGGPKDGPQYRFDALYQDIVENERIVYTYDMHMGDTRISVSLAAVEFAPDASGKGTRMTFTEHGVFLDGHDSVHSREGGTRELLANLERTLAS